MHMDRDLNNRSIVLQKLSTKGSVEVLKDAREGTRKLNDTEDEGKKAGTVTCCSFLSHQHSKTSQVDMIIFIHFTYSDVILLIFFVSGKKVIIKVGLCGKD